MKRTFEIKKALHGVSFQAWPAGTYSLISSINPIMAFIV
jgi:hypothetical protein